MFEELLSYNPAIRNLDDTRLFGVGMSSINLETLTCAIQDTAKILFSTDEEKICVELGELIRFKSLFLLLPEKCIVESPPKMKPLIREHLDNLGVQHTETTVAMIRHLCLNIQNKRRGYQKKFGIGDVYVKFPRIFQEKMSKQGGRCKFCGVILNYGVNLELDHILPWFLADDPLSGVNWQFLCGECNKGKGVFPYYSLNRTWLNWVTSNYSANLNSHVRFAALCRDKQCVRTGKKPSEAKMRVIKRVESGCWVFDNVMTVVDV